MAELLSRKQQEFFVTGGDDELTLSEIRFEQSDDQIKESVSVQVVEMRYRIVQKHWGQDRPRLGEIRGQEQAQQERLLLGLAEIISRAQLLAMALHPDADCGLVALNFDFVEAVDGPQSSLNHRCSRTIVVSEGGYRITLLRRNQAHKYIEILEPRPMLIALAHCRGQGSFFIANILEQSRQRSRRRRRVDRQLNTCSGVPQRVKLGLGARLRRNQGEQAFLAGLKRQLGFFEPPVDLGNRPLEVTELGAHRG